MPAGLDGFWTAGLTFNGSAALVGGAAQLTHARSTPVTDYADYQAGSVFANTPVDVTRFHNRFTFRIAPGYLGRPADGSSR